MQATATSGRVCRRRWGVCSLPLFIGEQVTEWLRMGLHGAHGIPAWHEVDELHGEP